MNTPTPVSDLIIKQFRAGEAHSDGLILTLRDMELNLTAALAEIDRLDVAGIHSCHANCQKSMCVMRRELTAVTEQRDELAESLDFQFKLNRECIDQITTRTKERDEAREQRDGLAEALRECRDDSIELLGERDSWQHESRGDYQERYQAIRDCKATVKEHAPISAGASVDLGTEVETTEDHVNRAADRGCCVSSCSLSLLDAIYRAFDVLDAPSDLLGTIGSIGATMDEEECVLLIEAWLESKKCSMYMATATQRAEAFLRTINKWTTTQPNEI